MITQTVPLPLPSRGKGGSGGKGSGSESGRGGRSSGDGRIITMITHMASTAIHHHYH